MARRLAVALLVVAVVVAGSGLVRYVGARADADDAQADLDAARADVAAAQAELDRLTQLDDRTRSAASGIGLRVQPMLLASAQHGRAAERLTEVRAATVDALRARDFAAYDALVGRYEATDDAVHETQVSLYGLLDRINADLLDVLELLAAIDHD